KGENVYYRVTGSATTTAPYSTFLARSTVTPISITGTLGAGPVTISRASGNTSSVDMILFDSNLNAIVGGSTHLNTTALTRTLTAGTYYLAVSNPNTANSFASPSDSTSLANNVTTSPDFVMNSSNITLANLDMVVTTGSGAGASSGAAKPTAFDVAWFTFTLTNLPTNPTCTLTTTP